MNQIEKKVFRKGNIMELKNIILNSLAPGIKQITYQRKNQEALKGTMHELMVDLMKTMIINELRDEVIGNSSLVYIENHMSDNTSHNGSQNQKTLVQEEIGQKLSLKNKNLVRSENKNLNSISLDDLDDLDLATIEKLESKGVRVIFPNLKYRQPKYQKMDSVLKYVENEDDKYGVKLVIMNFND